MNRLEAFRHLKEGKTLSKVFTKEEHGVSSELEVWIQYREICDFSRRLQPDHIKYGPFHVRFWEGPSVHWIHITPQQVISFIKRNFPK